MLFQRGGGAESLLSWQSERKNLKKKRGKEKKRKERMAGRVRTKSVYNYSTVIWLEKFHRNKKVSRNSLDPERIEMLRNMFEHLVSGLARTGDKVGKVGEGWRAYRSGLEWVVFFLV